MQHHINGGTGDGAEAGAMGGFLRQPTNQNTALMSSQLTSHATGGRVSSVATWPNDQIINDCVTWHLAELGNDYGGYDVKTEAAKKKDVKRVDYMDICRSGCQWDRLSSFLYIYILGTGMEAYSVQSATRELMLALFRYLKLDSTQYGWYAIMSYYSMLASGVEMHGTHGVTRLLLLLFMPIDHNTPIRLVNNFVLRALSLALMCVCALPKGTVFAE